jgi:Neuraminidase (sialidase)
VMASDSAGNLYALWNAGAVDKGPERIYFSRSSDNGKTWSRKIEVSLAPQGIHHAFPAITAIGSGDVRIAWMDARNAPLWNVYYRNSRDGGRTWSAEADLSTYVAGFEYIQPAGFSYPFGDYFELDIDALGRIHAVWGEGLNYLAPGSIWYARSR